MPKKLKSAVVTGASSGIGLVYAEDLASRQIEKLLITARREDRLVALKQRLASKYPELEVEILIADLSVQDGLDKLCSRITRQDGEFDALVNNAGFGSVGSFTDLNLAREKSMLALNCLAPVQLSHYMANSMLKAGGGTIINVCSTGSYQPLPFMATYGATKAFLYSFTLALAEELRGSGVHLMAHCPGPTESEFHLGAGLKKKLDFVNGMQPEPVVREALDCALRRKMVCINGYKNSFLALIAKLCPGIVSARIVGNRLRNYRRYTDV